MQQNNITHMYGYKGRFTADAKLTGKFVVFPPLWVIVNHIAFIFVKYVNSVNSCSKCTNCKLLTRKQISLLFISIKNADLYLSGMVSLFRASYV